MISTVEKIDSTVVVLVVGLSFTMCCANSETDIYILLFFFFCDFESEQACLESALYEVIIVIVYLCVCPIIFKVYYQH